MGKAKKVMMLLKKAFMVETSMGNTKHSANKVAKRMLKAYEGAAMDLEQTKTKKGPRLPKVDKRMLAAMKKRYLRWKKRKENQKDWSKVTWTPAQVRGSKRTAKAADKAETAEVVSDYVAEKAEK